MAFLEKMITNIKNKFKVKVPPATILCKDLDKIREKFVGTFESNLVVDTAQSEDNLPPDNVKGTFLDDSQKNKQEIDGVNTCINKIKIDGSCIIQNKGNSKPSEETVAMLDITQSLNKDDTNDSNTKSITPELLHCHKNAHKYISEQNKLQNSDNMINIEMENLKLQLNSDEFHKDVNNKRKYNVVSKGLENIDKDKFRSHVQYIALAKDSFNISKMASQDNIYIHECSDYKTEIRKEASDLIECRELKCKDVIVIDNASSTNINLDDSLDSIILDHFSDSEEIVDKKTFSLEICEKNLSYNPVNVFQNINNAVKTKTNIVHTSMHTKCVEVKLDDFEEFLYNDIEHKETNIKDFEELIQYFVVKHQNDNVHCNMNSDERRDSYGSKNYVKPKENVIKPINSTNTDEIISISSVSELDALNDIETISLSSNDAIEEMIQTNQNKSNVLKPDASIETETQEGSVDTFNDKLQKEFDIGKSDHLDSEASISKQDEDSCSGYNSSDFEFISEEEAMKDAFIKNFTTHSKNKKVKGTRKRVEIAEDSSYRPKVYKPNEERPNNRYINKVSLSKKYPLQTNCRYQQNHIIPEGNDYYNLFQEIYAPLPLCMLENKSTNMNPSSMHIEYQGIGFDMKVLSRQVKECDSDSEYIEEAEQNTLKILQAYPRENRKRRRRF